MKFSKANLGRIFVIRLEDGDIVHEEIQKFARDQSIRAAALIILGGADDGSRLVVGPEHDRIYPISPMEEILDHVHEVSGTGTLFPDEQGEPILHMHMACGRNDQTITGCVRLGVKTWHILEVILFELLDTTAVRVLDKEIGFKFLVP
jgi:predicted DNA-binding protein with PD1-like motif